MAAFSPYDGRSSKLILAFDVRTTHSGVSYRCPSQYLGHGSSKIPSIIYYDNEGTVRAVGAETLGNGMYERAEENGWTRTKWFMMHLWPRAIKDRDDSFRSQPPLPVDESAIMVLGDYLKYLLVCSKSYLEDTQPGGKVFWDSIEQTTEFVISYPNGWGVLQQSHMYKAAVIGGLIPNNLAGKKRLSFVSEGEANLYFATQHGLPPWISTGEKGVIIVDAGGLTINISAYAPIIHPTVPSYRPRAITPSRCYLQGSMSVSDNLHLFAGSPLVEDVNQIIQCFDNGTKLRFRHSDEIQFFKFGGPNINYPTFNIRFGQLKLLGTDVASFFEPSLKCTIDTIKEIREHLTSLVKHVVLVGGLAANDWFYQSINKAMIPFGVTVLRPHYFGGASVSIGAIAFKLDSDARQV